MKKHSLLNITCLVLLFSTLITAQQSYDMLYGFKAGLNFANFGGTDAEGLRSATGLNAGGLLRKYTNDNMFFQVEMLLSEKGALDNQNIDTINVEITWFLNYFEIPLLLGYDFSGYRSGKVHPVLTGGAFLAIKSSSTLRGNFYGSYNEVGYPDVKSIDYGFIFGGSIEFEIQESRLVLEVRYTKSLTVFDTSYQNWDFKNQVVTASIGYLF